MKNFQLAALAAFAIVLVIACIFMQQLHLENLQLKFHPTIVIVHDTVVVHDTVTVGEFVTPETQEDEEIALRRMAWDRLLVRGWASYEVDFEWMAEHNKWQPFMMCVSAYQEQKLDYTEDNPNYGVLDYDTLLTLGLQGVL